jgi:hypothetical protein
MASKLGAPRFLMGFDKQAELAAADCVASHRRGSRAPVGKVKRNPQALIEKWPFETVLHLQFIADPMEDRSWSAKCRLAIFVFHTAGK